MSESRKHSIERIGRSIYPLRTFGFFLFGVSILLSRHKTGASLDAASLIGVAVCLVYPQLAFFRYLRNELRETEIHNMLMDMGVIGALCALIGFTPAVALPYLIANSAANYALRGSTLVLKGLALAGASALATYALLPQQILMEARPIELIGPFLYLTIVTHYMGYLAYVRGISLIKRKKEAEEMAQLDFLTGLNNRRAMFKQARLNDMNPVNGEQQTTVVMIDLDYFKQINDDHGHDHGDAVLVEVSRLIESQIRETDLLARWGGEEFLILLPDTDGERGVSIAESIRETIANTPVVFNGVEHDVTLTIGVASYGRDSSFQETVQHADKALYQGKERGRNTVIAVKKLTAMSC